jgi:hypothetical protein
VAQHPQGTAQLEHLEGQVGVGVEDDVAAHGVEPGLDAAAQPAVDRMVHDPDPGVGRGEGVGDLRRAVGRAVVDDHQLVRGDLPEADQALALVLGGPDGALDVVLLVPHGEEDRQQVDLGGRVHETSTPLTYATVAMHSPMNRTASTTGTSQRGRRSPVSTTAAAARTG